MDIIYHSERDAYRVRWKEGKQYKSKDFSVAKHGSREAAQKAANEWIAEQRAQKIAAECADIDGQRLKEILSVLKDSKAPVTFFNTRIEGGTTLSDDVEERCWLRQVFLKYIELINFNVSTGALDLLSAARTIASLQRGVAQTYNLARYDKYIQKLEEEEKIKATTKPKGWTLQDAYLDS